MCRGQTEMSALGVKHPLIALLKSVFYVTHESPYFRILDRHQARVRTVSEDLMNWAMSTQFFLISDLTCLVGHIATTLGCPTGPSRLILDTGSTKRHFGLSF